MDYMDRVDSFCDKLADALPQTMFEEAVCCVRKHLLTEADFESLSEEEIAEAFPTMGVRKAVCRVVKPSQFQVSTLVT